MVRLSRILTCLLLLLLGAATAVAEDEQDWAYQFQMRRARELAARALTAGDLRLGREAGDAFLAAARLRPEDPVPVAEAGILALELGDGATASRMLAEAHRVAPESGPFHFLRGSILQARSEFQDAAMEFRASVAAGYRTDLSEERAFLSHLSFGLALVDALKLERALKVLEEAVAMRPEHPLVPRGYFNIAVVHRRLQQNGEAERVLRHSIKQFPSYAPAYGELGDLLTILNRHDEAMELLERAVRVDPAYAQGYLLKATGLTNRGKLEEADAAFREFEKRFPPTADSEFRRGSFFQANGEPKRALEHLRRSLALDPSRVRCHYLMMLCHRDLGEDDLAAKALERWKSEDRKLRMARDHEAGAAADRLEALGDGEKKERDGGGKKEEEEPSEAGDR